MTHLLTSARDRSGLFITAALHAGVAAIALLAVTTTTITRPPPPILSDNIPDAPRPQAPAPDPVIRELSIPFAVPLPDPIIETTPDADNRPLVTGPEPPVRPVAGTDDVVAPPLPLPAGATRIARFDPRHAASAQPPYPAASRRLEEEGTVTIHVRIGRDGRVLAATVAQSSGYPRLDAAALAHALAAWRFTPALEAGMATESTRDIKVDFRLAAAAA